MDYEPEELSRAPILPQEKHKRVHCRSSVRRLLVGKRDTPLQSATLFASLWAKALTGVAAAMKRVLSTSSPADQNPSNGHHDNSSNDDRRSKQPNRKDQCGG